MTTPKIPKEAWVQTDSGAYLGGWFHPQHMPRELQRQFPAQPKKCWLCGQRPPLHYVGKTLFRNGEWVWFPYCKPCDELMDFL